MQESVILQHTKKWLQSIVIGFNFCPFAGREMMRNSIHYQISESRTVEEHLEAFVLECKRLEGQPSIETSLVIFPPFEANKDDYSLSSFEDYLDLVALAEQLIVSMGYEGVFQVASFHPDYCFGGSEENDPSNFTNRSPYPILHILREESLERVLEHYPNPEAIPERNIAFARQLGLSKLQVMLQNCIIR